jgi:RNA polymerase sigma-70 factor (ECF subfamily)
MSESISIESLIRECQKGNAEAFHSLYDELAGKVFSFLRPRTKTRDDALDLLQDTFVDFWNSLQESFVFKSERELFAFLYLVASRKISKYYQKPENTSGQVDIDEISDFLSDGEDQESRNDTLDIVRTLGRIEEKDRAVIELRYFSGLPFSEIASLLSQSEGAIKVRLHRALEKIRKVLDYEK